jgi:LysM repeat protein
MKKALFVCLLSVLVAITIYAGPEHGSKHVVKQGETLYSISKTYGVKLKDLLQANPALTAKSNIKPGLKITIPGKVTVHSETGLQASNHKPKTTVIVPSTPDTPYKDEDNKTRIAAPVSTENPVAINTDQPVINSTPSAPYSVRTAATTNSDYPGVFNQYTTHGYKLSKTRGAANFLDDNTSGNPYLALYSNAETGSVIKVTNLMNKKTVYVKVVGRVPAIDSGKEVILKLSNKAAQELGALDAKFLVEVASVQAN